MLIDTSHPTVGADFRPRPKPARIQSGHKGMVPEHPWTEAHSLERTLKALAQRGPDPTPYYAWRPV